VSIRSTHSYPTDGVGLQSDGKQFVVIAVGGHGRLGTKLGDSRVAFALP
jgi:quinoprotein glucose dehydrogenase